MVEKAVTYGVHSTSGSLDCELLYHPSDNMYSQELQPCTGSIPPCLTLTLVLDPIKLYL